MNLMMVLGVDVCNSLFSSVCKLTVSKALLISRAIASVRCGGLFWLKPVVIILFIVCNAVVVECCVRKPCWCVWSGMLDVRWGRIIFSRVFAIGDRRAIGR